jgi:hypothetical protein
MLGSPEPQAGLELVVEVTYGDAAHDKVLKVISMISL